MIYYYEFRDGIGKVIATGRTDQHTAANVWRDISAKLQQLHCPHKAARVIITDGNCETILECTVQMLNAAWTLQWHQPAAVGS